MWNMRIATEIQRNLRGTQLLLAGLLCAVIGRSQALAGPPDSSAAAQALENGQAGGLHWAWGLLLGLVIFAWRFWRYKP